MKKNINLKLYQSIIDSDFFLLNSNNARNTSYIQNRWQLNSSDTTFSLDVVTLLKSLKQFIRLLQFIKGQHLNAVHINVANKQHFLLLKQFFKDYNPNVNIQIHNSFSAKKNSNKSHTEMILILGQEFNSNKSQTLKRLYDANIFLINKVNANLELNNVGTYKIFNDLFDFKKIIFMTILIDQVFKKDSK